MPVMVGITSGYKNIGEKEIVINKTYLDVIKKAGGIPILLTPQIGKNNLPALKDKLDGILLSGGGDIDPVFFNEEPDYNMRRIDPTRDRFEIDLVRWALHNKKPLLAICRGAQILNIACGGSIIQHLDNQHYQHDQKAPKWYPTHFVTFNNNGNLVDIFDGKQVRVNSFHHQAISELGTDVKVVAEAVDGVIEGIEVKDHPFAVGVQWHPERMYHHYPEQQKLFKEFIKICD